MTTNRFYFLGCLLLVTGLVALELLVFPGSMPYFAVLNPLVVAGLWFAYERLTRVHHQPLKTNQRAIEELLMQIDHEIQNPIAALKISLESLEEDGYSEPVARAMNTSLDRLEAVNRLYMRLLCLSTLTALPMQRCDFAELLRRAIIEGNQGPLQSNTQLVVRIPEEPLWLMGHDQLLYDALRYLFDYALSNSLDKNQLFITLCAHYGHMTLTIEQHGTTPTMTKDLLAQQILSFSGDSPRSKKPLGVAGLSLTLAKCVIEHHQGLIDYQYCGQKTTRYHVTLPLNALPEA